MASNNPRVKALEGIEETLKSLDALSAAARDGLRAAIRESTIRIQADARARLRAQMSRKATGRTYEAIRRIYFDDGDTGKVYVGEMTDDRGKRPKNLPLWIEYGTVLKSGRPFLIPAFEVEKSRFNALVEATLRNAERAGQG